MGNLQLINNSKLFRFTLIAAILNVLFYAAYSILEFGSESVPLYMFVYFEAFLLLFGLLFLIKRSEYNKLSFDYPESGIITFLLSPVGRIPALIIITGIIFRIILFPAQPSTSDDVYRYIWEGKVVAHGYNPFTTPPDSELLSGLQDDNYEKVSFKHIPAIYPPVSQLIFASAYLLSESELWGLKLIYLLCEIFTLLFLLRILLIRKTCPAYIVLYAWLPLPVMEYFINVHLDPLGIMFMTGSLYFALRKKITLSAVLLAFAILSKLYPAVLIPLFIKKFGLRKFIRFVSVITIVVTIFYLPFVYDNLMIITALVSYLSKWEFNGSVFNLLKWLSVDGETARIICAVLMTVVTITISIRYRDIVKASAGIFLSFFILSSTIYPWYLGWLGALNTPVFMLSSLSYMFTINFTNLTPMTEGWTVPVAVLFLQYIPLFAFMVYEFVKKDKDRTKD